MRLGDLLLLPVIDQHGRTWGRVRDAHVVQDGPLLASGYAAFRLHGLVVGRSVAGSRFSPRRLHRNAIYVPWPAVTSVEDDHVLVRSPEAGFASSTSRA